MHTPYQRAGSLTPAVLGSAAQSGSDDMLWEAKLVTFSSPWRGVLLAQLVICRKGQATDPAFPQCVWGVKLAGAGEPSALQGYQAASTWQLRLISPV